MVTRLFSANPFDEDVDKATSELIPKDHDDIILYLDISDQIRSKKVLAKDAMRALKRRITHSNPNVQLLALSLTDTCVKNGGNHFLIEVASREFVDSLLSIVKSSTANTEVRNKLLGLIQTWALAFASKPELSYVTETYRLLKVEGCVFPKVDQTSSVMIDTATPPEWTDSDECVRCRTPFTMFNRKHHCRNCGQTFCGECSSKTSTLTHIGINEPVRVCDACYVKRQVKARSSVDFSSSKSLSSPTAPPTLYSSFNEKDEELKKAIEISLKEAEYNKNYVQPAQQNIAKKAEPVNKQEEEMDEDLAAAIEASLREMQINQPRSATSYNTTSNYSTYNPYDSKSSDLSAAYELSTIETENIYQFSELLDRIQHSGGDLMRDRQVQALHDKIGELKPKLTKNLAETIQKHQDLVDMHEKLSQVLKIYDRLMEERMSNTYAKRSSLASYPTSQHSASSMIPSGGPTYPATPSIRTSNIYTQSPSYPVASAPAPSPTYYSAHTVPPSQPYIPPQQKAAESAPITSYTPNPASSEINAVGNPGEYKSNVNINQQGFIPQTNGTGSVHAPQSNSSNSAYVPPQANYGVDYGYQTPLQHQQAPPPQQNYYQYQTPPSSQQIHSPSPSHQIEEPLLIEL
ncbi:350_t:CDS:10 [Funneliformis mosseae]|uniref:Vacuolar protein sorting-associated protein 27 n=1 Tax=Funneliformis mosseae TaxID=27381 RepID=A0A9N8Z2E9_FUNMO|nr:350_t:CDS:10 [Funneliformis mosseae]